MILQLTLQNLKLPQKTADYLDYQVKRLDRYLPTFVEDLPLLEMIIRNHPAKEYFEGSITLHLPKQALNAHFYSRSLDQAIKLAFQKIKKELRNYKGQHFVGQSEYPDRSKTFEIEELE